LILAQLILAQLILAKGTLKSPKSLKSSLNPQKIPQAAGFARPTEPCSDQSRASLFQP